MMDQTFLRYLAAAFLGALLICILPPASLRAQTISSAAEARWTIGGNAFFVRSNRIDLQVDDEPQEIRTYAPSVGASRQLTFFPSQCAGPGPAVAGSDQPVTVAVADMKVVTAGEDLIFEIRSSRANRHALKREHLDAVIFSQNGDRETVTVFETAPDSGIFIGRIATRRLASARASGDCRLSVSNGEKVEIDAMLPETGKLTVSAVIDVLADPFGVLFDSETGDPVSGARVTLIDNATGAAATVFAEDGITPWPSMVVSGQSITDGAGTVYAMPPGEYWFPLAPVGTYRLQVEPPARYAAPSVVPPASIAQITGRQFAVSGASYGQPFALRDVTPVQIDIPLDAAATSVALTKSASRDIVRPGEAVFYTLVLRNPDANRVRRDIELVDVASPWLRLRPDSVRIDGQSDRAAFDISGDGRTLSFRLGDLAGGATRRITYAMVVRSDAPSGQASNRAEATDILGNTTVASATVRIERDNIAGRMTIIGRVSANYCDPNSVGTGIAGVRIMLEDGSFAITDADGRYNFDGVVPGTHVVQASSPTLPKGGVFVDCTKSTRSAGSATSRIVNGRGGSLVVADFHALVSEAGLQNQGKGQGAPTAPKAGTAQTGPTSAGDVDWLALGDGPDGWLFPEVDHNPRAPAVRVAIRHRKGQSVKLRVDGKPVDPLAFDGTTAAPGAGFAVSLWRGIPLEDERTTLSADIINSAGGVASTITRDVHFTSRPARVVLVAEKSRLIADGVTRPVVAVRVLDRNGRPIRAGIAGEFTLNSPFESAAQIDQQQINQLTRIGNETARWVIEGDDGIALIELAPTLVSGSLRLNFRLTNDNITSTQTLESWIRPGDVEWTIVGLAEGSVGARTIADNMERTGSFDSDLGENMRLAFYAKGRVKGKYLLTIAYDSAKQRDDQRVLGQIDPNAYYTVFADGSSRRFDAASRENLYIRIETATFYALYGDFETGFDQTQLTRYSRTATGLKAEGQLGSVHAQGFAAEVASRFRRDEIQGAGISGPYQLSNRAIIANSEKVQIEVRDRFRSELVSDRRPLTRFIDYEVDLLSGTITFKQPVASRDFNLNPQFIVVDYEVDALAGGSINGGARIDWTDDSGKIRVGMTAVTDKGDEARTTMGGIDLRARIGDSSEVRAEVALSHTAGENTTGWLVEAEHRTGNINLLAYARSLDQQFGVGQQNAVERGRRKFGVDSRVQLSEHLSVLGSVWQDSSLTDDALRRAAKLGLVFDRQQTDFTAGVVHFDDHLADGRRNRSTMLEASATRQFFDNRLEIKGATSIALDNSESIDLPARHLIGVRFALTPNVRLVGQYEYADGANIESESVRVGLEITPWTGGQAIASLVNQDIVERGNRSFAVFGLTQSLQVTQALTISGSLDANRTIGGALATSIVNPAQPVASGGQLGPDGQLFEDFAAATLGAAWRKDRWSASLRGEYRDGQFADRQGLTVGVIRQLGEGSVLGSGMSWTQANGDRNSMTEILDASLAFAFRPAESAFATLGKIEFRSDKVENAVAGEPGPVGRTALNITGDAKSERLLASVSVNWSPRTRDDNGRESRRHELGLFVGSRYNLDHFEGNDLSGVTMLLGTDARLGLGEAFEIGVSGNVRKGLNEGATDFSVGSSIGFSPAKGTLLTIGYNIAGFRDADFAEARETNKGLFAAVRLAFDADSFSILGLRK